MPMALGKNMRLAVINATGGGISGGYRNYLTNILPFLAADNRIDTLLCVSPVSLSIPEWTQQHQKIQFVECRPFNVFSRSLDRELGRLLNSFHPDVIFVPTARVMSFNNVPVVTMIQNMAPLVSWKWYGLLEKPRLAAQWLETFRAVRQADRVISISDFVRQFLLTSWGVNPEKIVSIYFGAPLAASNPVRPVQIPSEWTDFIFTAGSIEPYRCLEDIIKCVGYSKKSVGRHLKVVLAGSARKTMQSYERRLKTMAELAGVSADLCWTGQLSKEEMGWCYKNCSAFVMTSRVEAAPNTVLEAMACGAVCIAADNAPMPEFFAEAALYYNPGNGEMLAAAISDVLSWDSAKRGQVSAAAYERSRKFTWEITAEKTVNLFEQVSGTL